ncbi:MAG TPA: DsbA family protein [Anaerolineales bacterium]|nr:DsbA family protein [Anaerolineales bacterium]
MPTRTKTAPPILEPEVIDSSSPPSQLAEEDFVKFKRSHFYAVITVLAFATGVLLGYVTWGLDSASAVVQTQGAAIEAPAEEEAQFVRYNIPSEGFPSFGPKDAPITIVEFSDYQCPYCRRWHQEVFEPLFAAYPGKIRLVYRHLPLTSIHPDAFSAAEAAMCAGEQNAYWQFHDMLFDGEMLGSAVYIQYARELGLNMDVFESCMRERRYQSAVQADVDFAINLGVRSTPTFFINGLAIVGAQPLEVFKDVIDQELAGEIPK